MATKKNTKKHNIKCKKHQDLVEVNETANRTIMVTVEERDKQYTKCEDCGKYYLNNKLEETTDMWMDTKKVCPDCLDENYFLCPICGNYNPNKEGVEDDEDGIKCENC